MRAVVSGVIVAAGVALAGAAHAATPLNACDRMAANPPDPDRITIGVERKEMDLPKAIAACKKAAAEYPEEARFAYQLGRVLFYDNQVAPALASFQRAADANYRQARFMLGLLMTRKYPGVPQDDCKVAELWTMSARQGHVNAAVSLVRDALHGRFKSCASAPGKDDMKTFLKASEGKSDYLGNFLVEDLEKQLNESKG